jgi:hypothetical protein
MALLLIQTIQSEIQMIYHVMKIASILPIFTKSRFIHRFYQNPQNRGDFHDME